MPWSPEAQPPPPPARTPVPAYEVSWEDLLAHPDVTPVVTLRSTVGILAYHGGVELATLEVATEVAQRAGATLYGIRQPEILRWHVSSTLVDPASEPGLAAVLAHIRVALSLHGYGRLAHPWTVFLGGTNRDLAATAADALRAVLPGIAVVDDLDAIPAALRGVHPANPVNLPPAGGVQVELPRRLRRSPEHLAAVTDALAVVAAAASTDPRW